MCFTLKYTGKHLVTIIEFDIVYVIIQFNTFYYKYYIIQYYKIRYIIIYVLYSLPSKQCLKNCILYSNDTHRPSYE